jgi:hypothetical protein
LSYEVTEPLSTPRTYFFIALRCYLLSSGFIEFRVRRSSSAM